jgi:hypothetical protein
MGYARCVGKKKKQEEMVPAGPDDPKLARKLRPREMQLIEEGAGPTDPRLPVLRPR